MAFVVNSYTTLPSPNNSSYDDPTGINDAGTISGAFTSQSGGLAGYTLSVGTFSFPSFLDWNITNVNGVTNNGMIFGQAAQPDTVPFGWVDNNGGFIGLPSGLYGSAVTAMNDAGEAVGYNLDAQNDSDPFLYNVATGAETPITIQDLSNVVVTGINDSGQMVGYGFTSSGVQEGLFLDGKGGSELLNLPGAKVTLPSGLNNNGQIVGLVDEGTAGIHGFLFDLATNAYTTLNDPNATGLTAATGINNSGQVVGYYTDAHGTHGFEALIAHT